MDSTDDELKSSGVSDAAPMLPARTRRLLGALLVAQGCVSFFLMFQNTAFADEATYIDAGHAEIAALLHHVAIPPFAETFSGAPILYPPLAALADSVGGLLMARLVSLVFMLAATLFLFAVTERLFGSRAALLGAAAWVFSGPVLFLGAFATYDAMAVCLLAAAAWCTVASAQSRRSGAGALVAAGALLVAADVAKYAATLWDPAVILLAGLLAGRHRGARVGLTRAALLCAGVSLALFGLIEAGGAPYWAGIEYTTLARHKTHVPRLFLAATSVRLIGFVLIMGVAGAVLLTRRVRQSDPYLCAAAWVLVLAGLLAPVEYLRLASSVSLFKHDGYGEWFTAVPAGMALSLLAERVSHWRAARRASPRGSLAPHLPAVAVALLVAAGVFQAYIHYEDWANSTKVRPVVQQALKGERPPYLAEDPSVLVYDLHMPVTDWHNTYWLQYDHRKGFPAFRLAIEQHFFHVVVLAFAETARLDGRLQPVLCTTPGYRLVGDDIPEGPGGYGHTYEVWRYGSYGERRERRDLLQRRWCSASHLRHLHREGFAGA